jgi:hypothetical protein
MPYSPSVQHAKNTDIMVQCENCAKWRLIFSKKKLTKREGQQLNSILDDVSFTCGLTFGMYYHFFAFNFSQGARETV